MVWDTLCDKCTAKAERLLAEREASRLFDLPVEEHNFCTVCVRRINERFDEAYECMDKMKDVDDTNSAGTKINGAVELNYCSPIDWVFFTPKALKGVRSSRTPNLKLSPCGVG